jgi:hypothetical protein
MTKFAKKLAIKITAENWKKEQVLKKKLIQRGDVFDDYKPNKVAVIEQLN